MFGCNLEIILLIPQALSEGNQRETFTHADTYAAVLSVIHKTVECKDVICKPNLVYKLTTATQKSNPINLGLESDWEGCLESVAVAQNKKGTLIPVSIIVGKQVSILIPIWQSWPKMLSLSNCSIWYHCVQRLVRRVQKL